MNFNTLEPPWLVYHQHPVIRSAQSGTWNPLNLVQIDYIWTDGVAAAGIAFGHSKHAPLIKKGKHNMPMHSTKEPHLMQYCIHNRNTTASARPIQTCWVDGVIISITLYCFLRGFGPSSNYIPMFRETHVLSNCVSVIM